MHAQEGSQVLDLLQDARCATYPGRVCRALAAQALQLSSQTPRLRLRLCSGTLQLHDLRDTDQDCACDTAAARTCMSMPPLRQRHGAVARFSQVLCKSSCLTAEIGLLAEPASQHTIAACWAAHR